MVGSERHVVRTRFQGLPVCTPIASGPRMRATLRSSLRSRFFMAIAAGSALATVGTSGGCGGAVEGVPEASSGGTAGAPKASPPQSSSSSSSSGSPLPPSAQTSQPDPPPPAPPPAKCEWGKPEQACYTKEQLEAQYHFSPWGGEEDAG